MVDNSTKLIDRVVNLKREGASEITIRKSFLNYIEICARNNHIPLHGKFELTPLCNLDCKMCYIHLSASQFGGNDFLSVETWKRVINDAHKAGMLYASLTGGECLTYPGFDEIFIFLKNKGIIPSVLTNGLLLDSNRIHFFKKYPPKLIQVSLYGSSEDAYEKVTGHRVFNTIYHNLELLKESNLKVVLALTPNAFMRDDIRPLMETAKSLNIPFGINANLHTPRNNTGRELEDLEVEQYIEMFKIWKEFKQEELFPVDGAELPDENHDGKPLYGFQCGGGRSTFVIHYDGKMAPCPSMADLTTEPLQEGFIEAWHRLNNMVSKYLMPAECSECVYRGYCLLCPAIHNNAHNSGHCDPRICKRTKMLIKEGFIPVPSEIKEKSQ